MLNYVLDPPAPIYTWMQNAEEITATFPLAESVTSNDVLYKLTKDNIQIAIKNLDSELLQGMLYDQANVENSKWTLADNKLVDN